MAIFISGLFSSTLSNGIMMVGKFITVLEPHRLLAVILHYQNFLFCLWVGGVWVGGVRVGDQVWRSIVIDKQFAYLSTFKCPFHYILVI